MTQAFPPLPCDYYYYGYYLGVTDIPGRGGRDMVDGLPLYWGGGRGEEARRVVGGWLKEGCGLGCCVG